MKFEKDYEKRLVDGVKRLGGLCLKLDTASADGLPDRMILMDWCDTIFVELKREDGALSELQKYWIAKLTNLGYRVFVPKTKEDIDDILESLASKNLGGEIDDTNSSTTHKKRTFGIWW